MSVSVEQIETLKKEFKHLVITVVETSEDGTKAEAFTILYQKNGVGGRPRQGLIEVNAVWDERKSRLKEYVVVHASEFKNGMCLSIMATEEYYWDRFKAGEIDGKMAEWIRNSKQGVCKSGQ